MNNIPGFYYDEEKRRYFKLTSGQTGVQGNYARDRVKAVTKPSTERRSNSVKDHQHARARSINVPSVARFLTQSILTSSAAAACSQINTERLRVLKTDFVTKFKVDSPVTSLNYDISGTGEVYIGCANGSLYVVSNKDDPIPRYRGNYQASVSFIDLLAESDRYVVGVLGGLDQPPAAVVVSKIRATKTSVRVSASSVHCGVYISGCDAMVVGVDGGAQLIWSFISSTSNTSKKNHFKLRLGSDVMALDYWCDTGAYAGCRNGEVFKIEFGSAHGQKRHVSLFKHVTCVRYLRCVDETHILVCGLNNQVVLYNLVLEKVTARYKVSVGCNSVFLGFDISPNKRHFAVGSSEKVQVWDVFTGELVREIECSCSRLDWSVEGIVIADGNSVSLYSF